MEMVLSTWIARSREQIFEQLIDFPNLPQRLSGITRIEMQTPGPVAVGTRFRETRKMFGKDAVEEFTVSALDPNRSLTLRTLSCGMTYEAIHTLADENGGTRVTLTLRARTTSWFAWLMSPLGWLMQGMMKKLLQKDLDDLKNACERETQAA